MPSNPSRASQGGDVEGMTKTDTVLGDSIDVAKASFDPGYSIQTSLSAGTTRFKPADLMRGYCDYGHEIGDGMPSDWNVHKPPPREG